LLEGKTVNLKTVEKEDLPLISEWMVNPDFLGEFVALWQKSRMDWQKRYDNLKPEEKWFLIERKDGAKVGFIQHFPIQGFQEIGYALVSGERGKGYCSEGVQLIVDYLFLSKDLVRIQACTDVRNLSSQKVLEKVGFKKEGTIRKEEFVRGEWRDKYLYSILREEWKEPRMLTKEA
jgi:RimJ/RimL family protein N-acetyltransferase